MSKPALSLVLALLATGAAQAAAPAEGARLFQHYGCYACHGTLAYGATSSGPALAGRTLAPAYVIAYARRPRGVMPPYRPAVLSDADLATIARWITTLPAPRPAARIPQLARLLPDAAHAGAATAR